MRYIAVRGSASGHIEASTCRDIAEGEVVLVHYLDVLRVDDIDYLCFARAVKIISVVAERDVVLRRAVSGREIRFTLSINTQILLNVALGYDVESLGRVRLMHTAESKRLVVLELNALGRRGKLVDGSFVRSVHGNCTVLCTKAGGFALDHAKCEVVDVVERDGT